jgi:hypothetical protein
MPLGPNRSPPGGVKPSTPNVTVVLAPVAVTAWVTTQLGDARHSNEVRPAPASRKNEKAAPDAFCPVVMDAR